MPDLPEGPALLVLAREVLLGDLLPLLPPERQLDARFVAQCMAVAEREAAAPAHSAGTWELEKLYGPGDDTEWLGRFARDLRRGGFENSPERAALARAILWRLTIARLRLANPRFLAANGFG